jgi:selenocysteine-specific elongation factor
VLDYMQAAGLSPISPAFFWKQHKSQYSRAKAVRLFNYLYLQKKLIRLNDNRFLSLNAIAEIKRRVSQAIADKGFITLGDCKALFGYGRAGGAHVLDYLNQTGFTARREDKHYLNRDGGGWP